MSRMSTKIRVLHSLQPCCIRVGVEASFGQCSFAGRSILVALIKLELQKLRGRRLVLPRCRASALLTPHVAAVIFSVRAMCILLCNTQFTRQSWPLRTLRPSQSRPRVSNRGMKIWNHAESARLALVPSPVGPRIQERNTN